MLASPRQNFLRHLESLDELKRQVIAQGRRLELAHALTVTAFTTIIPGETEELSFNQLYASVHSAVTSAQRVCTVKQIQTTLPIILDTSKADHSHPITAIEQALRYIKELPPPPPSSERDTRKITTVMAKRVLRHHHSFTDEWKNAVSSITSPRVLLNVNQHMRLETNISAWLFTFCQRQLATIVVWEYNEDTDDLDLIFAHGSPSRVDIPCRHAAGREFIDWFSRLCDNQSVFFFILYDCGRRIIRLEYQVRWSKSSSPPPPPRSEEYHQLVHSAFQSSSSKGMKLREEYRCGFTLAEIQPDPLTITRGKGLKPTEFWNGHAQLFCRHPITFQVAPLGVFNFQGEWKSREALVSLLKEEKEPLPLIFHLTFPSNLWRQRSGARTNLTITVVFPHVKIPVLYSLPIGEFQSLIQNPNYNMVAFGVPDHLVMQITAIILEWSVPDREDQVIELDLEEH